jgi:hypothetical protein
MHELLSHFQSVTGGPIMILLRRAVAYSLLGVSAFGIWLVALTDAPNAKIIGPVSGCLFWLAVLLDRRRNGFGNG